MIIEEKKKRRRTDPNKRRLDDGQALSPSLVGKERIVSPNQVRDYPATESAEANTREYQLKKRYLPLEISHKTK